MKWSASLASETGRIRAISRSRPTMMRVAVMAHVAPAPHDRFATDHERCDLVDRVVHPVGLERRAVPTFVPAGVGDGRVQHPVDGKGYDRPPGAPQGQSRQAKAIRSANQISVSRTAGPIAALQQLAHLLLGESARRTTSHRPGPFVPPELRAPRSSCSPGVCGLIQRSQPLRLSP